MPKPTLKQMRERRAQAVAAAQVARAKADAENPPPPPALPGAPGRPALMFTEAQRQQVAVLISIRTPHEIIAMMLDISIDSLKRHFGPELGHGHERIKAAVGFAVVREALAGNIQAAKQYLSCFGGPEWRITEHRIIDGHIDYTDTTTDELERRRAELERLRATGDRARDLEAALPKQVH